MRAQRGGEARATEPKGSVVEVRSWEGDQSWLQMISRVSRSAVGEGGVAELERERRIGEPKEEDKVGEEGAGVVAGEEGEATGGAAGGVGGSVGGVGAAEVRSGRRERRAAGGG